MSTATPPNGKATKLLSRLATTEQFIRWLPKPAEWTHRDEPLTPRLVQDHIDGNCVLGAYGYADDSGTARTGVIDVDLHVDVPTPEQVAGVEAYAFRKLKELEALGIVCLLVRGHDRGSYHIIFDTMPITAERLGRWLEKFVEDAVEASIHVDCFPSVSGRGNAVRLPGRHHRKTDQWSASWSGSGWETWPAALDRLLALTANPAKLFPDPGVPKGEPRSAATGGSRPGDVLNLLVPVEDVLRARGWHSEREDGDRIRFTRPGKDGGISASVKNGTVWVHTSSVPGLPASDAGGRPYTAFGLIAHLDFGGDFKLAARELAKAGFCAAPTEPAATFRGKRVSEVSGVGSVGAAPREPIPPFRSFPADSLPEGVREYVFDVSSALNCDLSYSALPVLAILSAAIGTSHMISPKRGWREPAFVFATTIGCSGTTKSPPFRDVEDVAEDVNDLLEKEYDEAVIQYENDKQAWINARDEGKSGDELPEKPKAPVKRAFAKSDTTIQALATTLQANPRGILVACDELAGWISGFTRFAGKSGATDLPQWLQLSNAGTINITRKTGEPNQREIRVRGVGVSVCGTIQPGVIARAMTPELRAAGLLARLLLAYPPRRKRVWTESEVDDVIRDKFVKLVNELFKLTAGEWEGTGKPKPHIVKLTPEAKTAFVRFYNANGVAMERAGEDEAAARSKLEGYSLRFALIFHCCRYVDEAKNYPVGIEDMNHAIAVTEWFVHESSRVYLVLAETTEDREIRELHELVTRLAARSGRGGRITVRDLQNHGGMKKYPTSEAAAVDLLRLIANKLGDWVEDEPIAGKGGHRPKYFKPLPTPDTSYTRSENEDDEEPDNDEDGSDTCSDTCPPTKPGPTTSPGVKPEPADICDDTTSPSVGRVSEVSECRKGFEAEKSPTVEGTETESKCRKSEASVGASVGSPPYTLITDPTGISDVISAVEDGGGSIGCDLETTGLRHHADRVRLIQLATARGTFLIDVFTFPDPLAAFDELFEVLANAGIVGHNLVFDLPFLIRLGFTPGRVFDTMLASQVMHAGDITIRHGLKDVVARVLGITLEKELQKADWSKTLSPDMLRYAATDAELPLQIRDKLLPEIEAATLTTTVATENAALPAVAWASVHGVGFDRPAWETLATDAEAHRGILLEQLEGIAPDATSLTSSRNWDSPNDVIAAFASVGVKVEATDDDTLATISHPLAALVREYRSIAKRVGTYGT